MLATGTGIGPFRSFLWKMFFEMHEDYKERHTTWMPQNDVGNCHGCPRHGAALKIYRKFEHSGGGIKA